MEYAQSYAKKHNMTTKDAMKDPKVKKLYQKDKDVKDKQKSK